MDLEFIAQSGKLLLGADLCPPSTQVGDILLAMGNAGALPEAARLAEIHATYTAAVQTMSICLTDPFKAEDWTDAFRDLLARLTNFPDFAQLEAERIAMGEEVRKAAESWYARARTF
jgi:glutamate-ammonia-ligase adenylyltransferase